MMAERISLLAQATEKNEELERKVNFHSEEAAKFRQYWLDESAKQGRIKEQVGALKMMMDAIFNPII